MVRRAGLAVGAVVMVLVAGCTGTPAPQPSSSTAIIKTFTPEEIAAADAKAAYAEAYLTLVKMGGQPQAKLVDYPTSWMITDHVTDPYLTEIVKSLSVLQREGIAGRDLGMEPVPTVKSVSLGGGTPQVIVTWCPPKPDQLYDVRTGKDLDTTAPSGTAKPPWLITSTMVRVGDKWKLSKVAFDSRSTCKA